MRAIPQKRLQLMLRVIPKFSEGTLSVERLSYEQSTRTSLTTSAERSVKKALEHSKTKGPDVAVM